MILAIDTSTAACSVALFAADGELVARAHTEIGRGHAERLVPMIAEVLGDHIPSEILVGVGPGSFTGIRVGIAAAQGLAIGWHVPVHGMSSMALIAAAVDSGHEIGVAMAGGHGELFVQAFSRDPLTPIGEHQSLVPSVAGIVIRSAAIMGPAAETLVTARGSGEAMTSFPDAALALRLPKALRDLPPKPLYGRPPDAKPQAA